MTRKNLTTIVEKSCSQHFQNLKTKTQGLGALSFTTQLMRCVLFEKQQEDDLQKFLSVFLQGRFLLKIFFGLCALCSKKIRLTTWDAKQKVSSNIYFIQKLEHLLANHFLFKNLFEMPISNFQNILSFQSPFPSELMKLVGLKFQVVPFFQIIVHCRIIE